MVQLSQAQNKVWGKGDSSDLITYVWMEWFNTHNPTYCTGNKEGNERTSYILDTLSTEYTQQAFTHASWMFHSMRSTQESKYRQVSNIRRTLIGN